MKFAIETYGCQMNSADSELVSSLLRESGWEETNDLSDADLVIFNTCSVRKHAEDRVLGRISNEKHRKSTKPGMKIAVIGCMAQRMGKRLWEIESGIDYIVGVDQYNDLPHILAEDFGCSTEFDSRQLYVNIDPQHSNNTCAFVTVMRGCDNFCSYCIVPYVRGRERSIPFDQVYKEVERCGELGMKEVTLLGQNVNSYKYADYDFPKLLKELAQIESIHRLRFITSHPKDLSEDLIRVMASEARVCEHIHLPMQSGDDAVLQAMNRKYGYSEYLDKVYKLRNAMPGIAITTDLIAGFPGETDEMFERTLDAIRQIQFDYAFCFKYSERSGTKAAELREQVPEQQRLERLQRMIDLQREITLRKFSSKIGQDVEVYVENISKKSKRKVTGKTRDFKIAVVTGDAHDIGKLKTARVVDATAGTLICE